MLLRHAQEIVKSAQSFEYFCENYLKIVSPTQGLLNFSLLPHQKRLAEAYDENRFVILSKWRNGGLVTTTLAYMLWQAMFHENQKILWLAPRKRDAVDTGEMFDRCVRLLPEWMAPRMVKNTQYRKVFDNGNSICFYNPTAARGSAASHIVIDEAAFIPKMHQHWKAVWPITSTGGKCFVLSTVNPDDPFGWFGETYLDAQKNRNWFFVFESNYLEHPQCQDEKYCEEMRRALGEEGWHQEVLQQCLITPKLNPTQHRC